MGNCSSIPCHNGGICQNWTETDSVTNMTTTVRNCINCYFCCSKLFTCLEIRSYWKFVFVSAGIQLYLSGFLRLYMWHLYVHQRHLSERRYMPPIFWPQQLHLLLYAWYDDLRFGLFCINLSIPKHLLPALVVSNSWCKCYSLILYQLFSIARLLWA